MAAAGIGRKIIQLGVAFLFQIAVPMGGLINEFLCCVFHMSLPPNKKSPVQNRTKIIFRYLAFKICICYNASRQRDTTVQLLCMHQQKPQSGNSGVFFSVRGGTNPG
nr:MAG TPA: hypothetical protein [Caudoviricetes sp.]